MATRPWRVPGEVLTVILALDTDSVLYLYASEDEACRDLEAVDIDNQEYEFCTDSGQRLIAEITTPVTAFRSGAFRLVSGEIEATLPMAFVDRAREIGRTVEGISSLDDLRRSLTAA